MKKRILKNSLLFFIIFFCVLLIFSASWIKGTFGLVTFDEILFHLTVPLDGTNSSYIFDFIFTALLPSIFISLIVIFIVCYNYKYSLDFIINFRGKDLTLKLFPFTKIIKILGCTIFCLYSIIFTIKELDIKSYIDDIKHPSTFIEEVYVEPSTANITFPDKKRNLIYIYLESMESSYASVDDGGIVYVNTIPNLTKLAKENISFSNTDKLGGALNMTGTNWTMGAMVAHSSGLPLKISIGQNSYGKYKKFLPGVTTIGDILEENGYNQTLLIGSRAIFGGREKFYTQHGNYNIWDWDSSVEDGLYKEEDYEWWGFEDSELYEYAKDELTRLSSSDKPFNLTMLTVDTHFEDGWISEGCMLPYADQYMNVISCADTMLMKFLDWLKTQPYYKDTTIVIAGDHLTMDMNFFDDYDPNYIRTSYNVFINSSVNTKNIKNRTFATVDLFPTTLASLGANFDGDRLALGTNLFSDSKTIFEEYGYDYVNEELKSKSTFYTNKFILNNIK